MCVLYDCVLFCSRILKEKFMTDNEKFISYSFEYKNIFTNEDLEMCQLSDKNILE